MPPPDKSLAQSSFFSSSPCPTTARQLTRQCVTPHPSRCPSRSGAQRAAPTKQLFPYHQSRTQQLSCTIPIITAWQIVFPSTLTTRLHPSPSLPYSASSCLLKSSPPNLMFVMAVPATKPTQNFLLRNQHKDFFFARIPVLSPHSVAD